TNRQNSVYPPFPPPGKNQPRVLTNPTANLTYNTTTPYYDSTDYSSSNQTLSHSLWHSLNIDHGVIALPDTYARAHNLPLAQRFPWDATKGIYILHGYHNLHCLKIISLSLHEYRLSLPQTRRAEHISHCLDALRRQILCDADDTPRATYASHNGVSGLEQNRQCRNWGALESWAKEHTACYRRPERPVEGMRGVEKFRWCPEGSGYQVPEDGWGGEEWMSWEGL
ncbi:MAG: hypothetical protein LQ338_006386, partial [Usnochroma carphineum]